MGRLQKLNRPPTLQLLDKRPGSRKDVSDSSYVDRRVVCRHQQAVELNYLSFLSFCLRLVLCCYKFGYRFAIFTARRAERGIYNGSSVRLSVTRVDCIKTAEHIIEILSLSDSLIGPPF